MDPRTARLVGLYEEGCITEPELAHELVRAAVPPEEIAADLPPLVVARLRDWSASPPASFESTPRTFAIGSVVGPRPHAEEERANDRWLTYEGLWRWHRYFRDRAE
jgi:hypothetical protein